MDLKKGWLDRQLNHVAIEVKRWPDWMQKEASSPRPVESGRSQAKKSELPVPKQTTRVSK
jgi:hypothetical protein